MLAYTCVVHAARQVEFEECIFSGTVQRHASKGRFRVLFDADNTVEVLEKRVHRCPLPLALHIVR